MLFIRNAKAKNYTILNVRKVYILFYNLYNATALKNTI